MPLKDRRGEYRWGATRIDSVKLMTNKKEYGNSEPVSASVSFRIVGGLREAFGPDVWTVAWENFDKVIRLTTGLSVRAKRGLLGRKVAEIKKEVRRASFYWSRDPDLPYRIWPMIVPEDGGPPLIPSDVEDAKSKFLDVTKTMTFDSSVLGSGKHSLFATAAARWGRRSFIEKGKVEGKSSQAVIQID